MDDLERNAINLTLKHEWMTVYQAKLLLHDAYMRYRSQSRFGGWKTVHTLIGIDFGIWMRSSQEYMQAKLDIIESRHSS